MNNYYIIGHDYNGKYADMDDWEGNQNIVKLSTIGKTEEILQEDKLIGVIKTKKKIPDVINCCIWVISNRIKSIIESVKSDGIHFWQFDIKVIKKNEILKNYYLMSFTKEIDNKNFIDFNKSIIKFMIERAEINKDYSLIRDFKKLHILENNSVQFDIFQLSSPHWIFISDNLKQKFDEQKVTGFTYTTIEEYNERWGKK